MQGEQTLSWSPGAVAEWLRRFWPALVIGTVLGCLAGLAYSQIVANSYTATTQLVVGPTTADTVLQSASDNMVDARLQQATQAGVLRSDQVRQEAERALGRPTDVTVSVIEDSQLIEVSATAGSPDSAVDMANTYVSGYIQMSQQQSAEALAQLDVQLRSTANAIGQQLAALDAEIAAADPDVRDEVAQAQSAARLNLQTRAFQVNGALASAAVLAQAPPAAATVTTPAASPQSPDGLGLSSHALLGGLVGLFLAGAACGTWDLGRQRMTTRRQVAEMTGLTFLAQVKQSPERSVVQNGGLLAGLLTRTGVAANKRKLALVTASGDVEGGRLSQALTTYLASQESTAVNRRDDSTAPEAIAVSTPSWRFETLKEPGSDPEGASRLVSDYDAALLVVEAGRSTRRQVDLVVELLEELDVPTLGFVWLVGAEKGRHVGGSSD